MAEARPSLEEWRRLYEAAIRLKEIAPWEWMEETDIFGVQNPETSELGFVSIMGQLGEHYALALYLGADGLYRFWEMEMEPERDTSPDTLLAVPELQISFEDRDQLNPEDRTVIKELGLKFRGRQAWPLFRSYRPGFFPWYLEPAEARFLAYAVEQAIDVAPRFREDPSLLEPPGEYTYLVRVPHQEGETLVWEDQVLAVPPEEPEPVRIPMDMQALEAAKELPRMAHVLEVDFSVLPIRIGEKGARPRYPYLLLLVDGDVGFIYGSEFLEVETTVEATWGMVPLTLVRHFINLKMAPQRVRVTSPMLAQVLAPLAHELGFDILLQDKMPALDEARESLSRIFS